MNERRTFDAPSTHDEDRLARIQNVIFEHVRRRLAGENVLDELLIRRNPELMPELGEQLKIFSEVADQRTSGEDSNSTAIQNSESSRGIVSVRCPHCHQSVPVTADESFRDITCSGCGSRFSLTGDTMQVTTDIAVRRLGHFDLVEKLGVGNFGTVWKARDTKLDRNVAVKVPRQGQLQPNEVELFLREARAAAQLRHPNIVSVHEVGRENGSAYIVSDLVHGVPLSDWLMEKQPAFQTAAALCARIAMALHHAHQAGVIHRDLKPQNIMMDVDGEPHLMDFGLAKRDAGEVTMTIDGHLLGTPAYMSPEQARGEAHRADRRTDIFSLGVILFELLTGELPFRGNARTILHQVLHDEAPSPRKLNSSIPKDLETICLKCLEKTPSNRYESAELLADELHRYLECKPILARPIPRYARLWRWCRRNPMAAIVVSLVLLIAIISPIVAVRQSVLRHAAYNSAMREKEIRSEMFGDLYARDMQRALLYWHNGQIQPARELLHRYRDWPQGELDLRGFEFRYLKQALQDTTALPRLQHEGPVASLSYSADGSVLAAASGNHVYVWDAATRNRRSLLDTDEGLPVTIVRFSPTDRQRLVGVVADRVFVWDVMTGVRQLLCDLERKITSVAIAPDGQKIALGDRGGFVSMWALNDGTKLKENDLSGVSKGMQVVAMAFSPDGKTLAVSVREGGESFLDADTLERQSGFKVGTAMALDLAFSDEGNTLTRVGADALITFWDLKKQQEITTVVAHAAPIARALNVPQRSLVATASRDGTVKLWDTKTRRLRTTLRGHASGVSSAALSPDGTSLASGSLDGEVVMWSISDAGTTDLMLHGQSLSSTSVSPTGRSIVSSSLQNSLKLWDAESAKLLKSSPKLDWKQWSVAFAPDGKRLALGTHQGIKLWDVAAWREIGPLPGSELRDVWPVTYSPDGMFLAAASSRKVTDGGGVEIWEVASQKLIGRPKGRWSAGFGGLAFSPHGKMLAIPRREDRIDIWDVDARHVTTSLSYTVTESTRREYNGDLKGGRMVKSVAFSPDGRTLAAAMWGGRIILWDVATGKHKSTIVADRERILHSIAFTPDGTTLASGGSDGTIKLWSLADERKHREVGALYGHVAPVTSLNFLGKTLVSGSYDTTIRLWCTRLKESD